MKGNIIRAAFDRLRRWAGRNRKVEAAVEQKPMVPIKAAPLKPKRITRIFTPNIQGWSRTWGYRGWINRRVRLPKYRAVGGRAMAEFDSGALYEMFRNGWRRVR